MPKSILDKSFRYTPAASTDVAKTFERIRREQKKNAEEAKAKVQNFPRRINGSR